MGKHEDEWGTRFDAAAIMTMVSMTLIEMDYPALARQVQIRNDEVGVWPPPRMRFDQESRRAIHEAFRKTKVLAGGASMPCYDCWKTSNRTLTTCRHGGLIIP